MTAAITKPVANAATHVRPKMLPLEPGDRLTRAEFERRWGAMPWLKKAELIDGRVFMAAALRYDWHGEPHARLMAWLGVYVSFTRGLRFADNASCRLDADSMPQPDAMLMLPTAAGGAATIEADGIVHGPPELVAEIAASSSSYDLDDKYHVYRRHGVKEYVVWRVLEEAIDWFVLRDGRYDRLEPDADGVTRSSVFPGLWLDRVALIAGDLARVVDVVQTGCGTPEHQAFAAKLSASHPAAPPV